MIKKGQENEKAWRKKQHKKAQLQMSFQFIFSIILVVVVIFVGFYVINIFLKQAETTKMLSFVDKLNTEVDSISGEFSASQTFNATLSTKIQFVCFANPSKCTDLSSQYIPGFCQNISQFKDKNKNMFFYPLTAAGKYAAQEIYCEGGKECLFLPQNPNCIQVENGKIGMRIVKENETSKVQIFEIR
jgi:uncharacterized protein (UPF0333 family)